MTSYFAALVAGAIGRVGSRHVLRRSREEHPGTADAARPSADVGRDVELADLESSRQLRERDDLLLHERTDPRHAPRSRTARRAPATRSRSTMCSGSCWRSMGCRSRGSRRTADSAARWRRWRRRGAATGDFGDFFTRYVSGLDELPYDSMLTRAGLKLEIARAPAARSIGVATRTDADRLDRRQRAAVRRRLRRRADAGRRAARARRRARDAGARSPRG